MPEYVLYEYLTCINRNGIVSQLSWSQVLLFYGEHPETSGVAAGGRLNFVHSAVILNRKAEPFMVISRGGRRWILLRAAPQ